MVTEYGTRKLGRMMRHETRATPLVLLGYVLMMLAIVGMGWLAAPKDGAEPRKVATAAAKTMAVADRPSRIVFEERRRKFAETHPKSRVAQDLAQQGRPDTRAEDGNQVYASE